MWAGDLRSKRTRGSSLVFSLEKVASLNDLVQSIFNMIMVVCLYTTLNIGSYAVYDSDI